MGELRFEYDLVKVVNQATMRVVSPDSERVSEQTQKDIADFFKFVFRHYQLAVLDLSRVGLTSQRQLVDFIIILCDECGLGGGKHLRVVTDYSSIRAKLDVQLQPLVLTFSTLDEALAHGC